MAITQTFDSGYPNHPWANMDTLRKTYTDDDLSVLPPLLEVYQEANVFGQFIQHQFDVTGTPTTRSMEMSGFIAPHPNFNEAAAREVWMPASRMDTYSKRIDYKYYRGKMAYHKFDAVTTYLKLHGRSALPEMINFGVSQMLTGILHMLQRNAFLNGAVSGAGGQVGYALYGHHGTGTSFASIGSTDRITTPFIENVNARAAKLNVPYMLNQNEQVLMVTPAVASQLRAEEIGRAHV